MKRKLVDTNMSISVGGRAEEYWFGRCVKSKFSDADRKGDDVDLYALLHKYSLRGFEFGNWLSNNDRYDHILACQDALNNLAWLMHTHNLGIDRQVGIAFGARGSNRALAHYEPDANMINLTKIKGHQSLAHEYGHALDWNFGRYVDQNKTYNWLTGGDSIAKTLPQNTGTQFRHYANAIVDTIKTTDSYARISEFGEYWHRRTEIFARAFEQYVCYCVKTAEKSGASTRYLCKSWSYYTGDKVYLTEADFKKVLPLFKLLVAEFGKCMNNKGALRAMPYYMAQTKVSKPLQKTAQTPTKPKATPKVKTAPKPKVIVASSKITQEQAAKWLYTLVKIKKNGPDSNMAYSNRILYTANGSMVASDGYVMAYIPAEIFVSTPKKDVILHDDGRRTDVFPKKWNSIWPKSLSKPVVLDIAAELKRTSKKGIRNYSEEFEYYEKAGFRFDKTRYKRTMTFLKHFGKECLFEANTAANNASQFSIGTMKVILMPLAK